MLTEVPGLSQQKKDAPVIQRNVSVAIGVLPAAQFPLQKNGKPSLLPWEFLATCLAEPKNWAL